MREFFDVLLEKGYVKTSEMNQSNGNVFMSYRKDNQTVGMSFNYNSKKITIIREGERDMTIKMDLNRSSAEMLIEMLNKKKMFGS